MSEVITKPGAKHVRRGYSAEEVESALQLLFLRNNHLTWTSQDCGIPAGTIQDWRDRQYADRWQQICAEGFPRLHAKVTALHEQNAVAALVKQREALEALEPKELEPAALGKVIQNLSVASGVHTDKAWMGRDKPTNILEHRSAQELLDSIQRQVPQGVVDAEVVELPAAAELEEKVA